MIIGNKYHHSCSVRHGIGDGIYSCKPLNILRFFVQSEHVLVDGISVELREKKRGLTLNSCVVSA
jgi:hypothetical protein